MTAFAHIQRERFRPHHNQPHGSELLVLLDTDDQVAQAQRQLHGLIGELIPDAAVAGIVRDDISPEELAGYCVHSLEAAGHTGSEEAVSRLVMLTMAGMRPNA